mgnify:CR=1 FL=1
MILWLIENYGYKYNLSDYCEKIESSSQENARRMKAFFSELDSMDYYATSDGTTLYAARPISLSAVRSRSSR